MTVTIISNTLVSQTNGNRESQGTSANTNQTFKAPGEKSGNEVQLTPEFQRLRDLEASLVNEPDIHQQRIEALQKAIDDGHYEVDATSTAAKLLGLESDLFR